MSQTVLLDFHGLLYRCKEGPMFDTNKHIDEYALVGLRTLAIAIRVLSEQELKTFDQAIFQARQAIEGREEKIMVIKNTLVVSNLIFKKFLNFPEK